MKRRIERAALSGSLLALAAWCAPSAWALDLPELAQLLSQHRNAEARFAEERFVSGLDQPLRSTGTLSFTPPDHFTRTTLTPRPETLSVEGNRVTLTRGGRTRHMTLDAVPEATALLQAMRGVLSGDLSALQSNFEARVLGNATRWRLSLRPLAQRVGTQVRELDIEGERGQLKTVEVLLAGGDRSVMTVTPLPAASASAPAPAPAPASASASASAGR